MKEYLEDFLPIALFIFVVVAIIFIIIKQSGAVDRAVEKYGHTTDVKMFNKSFEEI